MNISGHISPKVNLRGSPARTTARRLSNVEQKKLIGRGYGLKELGSSHVLSRYFIQVLCSWGNNINAGQHAAGHDACWTVRK